MGHCHAPMATSTNNNKELVHWSIENGTKIVLAPIPDAPLTCLNIWCRAGSYFESPGEEGLAHFLEHMVFKGSSSLKAGEFDLKIEALGGSSNAATGFDDVNFHVLAPPKAAISGLELLLNLVLTPSLNEQSFCLEREVVLEEIAQYKDQPDEQAFQRLLENCWSNHAYGRSILGNEASLKNSNPDKMRIFHRERYTGENCCLVISGVIPDGIENFINNSLLADLPNRTDKSSKKLVSPSLNFQNGREEITLPRLESSRLLIAWQFSPANDQKMIMGADLATSLLAEGRRSRLVQRLREDLQLVEAIDMDLTVLEEGSLVMLEALCKEDHIEKVEQEIVKVLEEVVNSPLPEKELLRSSQLVRNGILFNLEAPFQVANQAGSQNLWGRNQSLLEPLNQIDYWNPIKLQNEVLTALHPRLGHTVIARPSGKPQ